MFKRILIVLAIFLVLFGVSYGLHNSLVEDGLSFSLLGVYAFHAIAANSAPQAPQ